jgi:hypothetical protein
MIAEAQTIEPEVLKEKPHLSPTQLNMISMCPEQYRRRYIEGEILPPGIAMMKGSALHKGAEVNMRQKLASGVDLPAVQIVEAAVAGFEGAIHGSYALSDEEASRGAGIVLGEAKDAIVRMAQCHATEQAPEYQPVMVEEKVRIVLPGPRDLLGIIDLADTRDVVTDFKTAARKKQESEADTSLQLSTYAAAFETKMGRPPAEVRLDVVVQTKKGNTSRQLLRSERGPADNIALANRINTVARLIESGIFIPAPVGAWNCSQKWCGYWRTCPYVNSERAALQTSDE